MAIDPWLTLMTSLLVQRFIITNGATHWIVTEDGRLQAQTDSVYNLRRPYDLVAFMKQEQRASTLNDLKKELLNRKDEIDRNEDRDSGLEQKFYKTDPDCIEAGKPLPEFDLYISTVLPLENKGIRPDEHIDVTSSPSSNPRQPDCTAFMDLEFSMHAFEHLEGLKARTNLTGSPELGLKNAITHRESVDDYGHMVFEAMMKNKSSWILYNMAAFYWRIKGNPYHAVECIRRALHHSPRLQKDVALISLANIMHRARFSNEAAILVHAALEVSKELNVNHFTLGNIYAVLGEYNKSIICFENTLKIQPDFEAASKRRHAVLCHSKLEMALEAQHRSLQRTLEDLKDYQRKHDLYQSQSDKLLAEQVPHEVKIAQHHAFEQQKMRERSLQMVSRSQQVEHTKPTQGVSQCGGKNGKQYSTDQDDMLFSTDFTSKLDEVSDYYEKQGLCEGDECSHLRVQQGNQRPHTKLELVDGVIRPQLIFLQVSSSEMQVDAEDCIIFNDGSKSAGCNREEFRTYVEDLQENIHRLERKISAETGHQMQCSISFREPEPGQDTCGGPNVLPMGPDGKKKSRKTKKPAGMKDREKEKEKESDDTKEKIRRVPAPPSLSQPLRAKMDPSLPDFELPETDVHLERLGVLPVEKSECDQPEVARLDLKSFPGTQIHPRSLGIRLSDHLDFLETISVEDQKIPLCHTELISSVRSLEHLAGVGWDGELDSGVPTVASHLAQLEHILQTLDVEVESVSTAGTRIAHALAKNSTSWLAHLLASYYWQVEGRGDFALGCLKVALTFVPYTYRHCPLLSLVVLLQQSGHLLEAVVATSAALDINRENVIIHFTLANIYCQMGSWTSAVLFYQSTLGFEPHHLEAQARLRTILCRGLAKQIS